MFIQIRGVNKSVKIISIISEISAKAVSTLPFGLIHAHALMNHYQMVMLPGVCERWPLVRTTSYHSSEIIHHKTFPKNSFWSMSQLEYEIVYDEQMLLYSNSSPEVNCLNQPSRHVVEWESVVSLSTKCKYHVFKLNKWNNPIVCIYTPLVLLPVYTTNALT